MVNSLVTNLRAHSPWVHQASAGESSATPTLESCRNDPNRYAQAVEKHFGHNMAELCAHIAQRSESEQKAVIDGSKAFRAFLGIRNPNRLSRKLLPFGSSSSSSRISALDAPAALVMAATRSGDNGRVLRSLTRLRESLTEVKDKHRRDLPNGYGEFAEPVLDKLAQELGKLGAKQALEIAVSIFKDNEDSFLYFDKKTLDHIISALNEAQKKDIGNELKTSMVKLGNNAGMCKWEQDVLKESINNKDRGRFEKRVRFEIPQKHSTPSRPQGETSNPASQRPFLRRLVDLNKRQPASHPDQSTQAQNNPPEVPDRLRKKAEAISWKRIAKRDKEFSKYAKLVVDNALNGFQPDYATMKLDQKYLPLIAEMENHRNPGLNLLVFHNPMDCYNAIAKMKSEGKTGSFRILYPPFIKMEDHHIALDVKLAPGKPISIIAFESSLGEQLDTIKNNLSSGVENARVHIVPNIIQFSQWDCVMFSLNNALKSFKTHAEFAEKIHQRHQRASKRDIPSLPPVFMKHIHSRSMAAESPNANQIVSKIKTGPAAETLRQRVEAFRADRRGPHRGLHYSTSIEGFRLQEIKRVEDYLNQRAAASGMRRSVAWFS